MALALILAGGSGERLGADRPKALVELAGRPLLQWSVEVLRVAPEIERIVVALPSGAQAPEGTIGVPGGAVRSQSVQRALAAAGPGGPVLVHDAARPLLTVELVEATLAAGGQEGVDAAIAATPLTDTVKRAIPAVPLTDTVKRAIPASANAPHEVGPDGDKRPLPGSLPVVVETLDRSQLWAVQTPQVFGRAALERALDVSADVLAQATDDAWLVERTGGRVVVVPAPAENLKVTTGLDLALAELLMARREA